MPGRWITMQQIRLYMQSIRSGDSKTVAAAKAGFSERSAYNIENRDFTPTKRARWWKTRKDPFDSVWLDTIVPLLEAQPNLQARTILDHLQSSQPELYPEALLRTLQRRLKQWRATSGPDKEVIFRQKHPAGWQSISDFTDASQLKVTIRGAPFPHLLYHFRLPCSGWEYFQVIQGGESYSALAEGMQNAFWEIGGVTKTHRTDSLSAAYKNCSDKSKEEFTESYRQLCEHYGVEPTRNNKGVSHENGAIEAPHAHLKNRIDQALMLRGSRDFDSLEAYKSLLRELSRRHNKQLERAFLEERAFLQSLPMGRTCDYTEERVKVTSSSTISVKEVIYSVPARLIGEWLKIHLYDDRLECYVSGDHVITLKRLRRNKKRLHHIDYRHIIDSLVRKPQAFRNYIYRNDLFPTPTFSQAWEYLDRCLDNRQACKEFVKILHCTARFNDERAVEDYLQECLMQNRLPKSEEVSALFRGSTIQPPLLKEFSLQLSDYDLLLRSQGGAL